MIFSLLSVDGYSQEMWIDQVNIRAIPALIKPLVLDTQDHVRANPQSFFHCFISSQGLPIDIEMHRGGYCFIVHWPPGFTGLYFQKMALAPHHQTPLTYTQFTTASNLSHVISRALDL